MAFRKKSDGAAPSATAKSAPGKGAIGKSTAGGTSGNNKSSGKAAGAGASKAGREASSENKTGRLTQIRLVYKIARQRDPSITWWTLLGFLVPVAVAVLLGVFLGPLYVWLPIGILLGLVVGLNLFSRRVQQTAYAEMEGQPGAAAGVVERMRGEWRLTLAVGVNRNQDVVHRVVCKAGVVIIAEGRGRGPRDLLAAEKRRIRKIVGDTPVHDLIVGNGEGEVPLPKVQSTLMRLPRSLRKREVDALDRRLRAVTSPTLPIPKGPIPKSIPRGGRIR